MAERVGDHERRVGEQDSITVSGSGIRPADGLLDVACPASVQDLAVPSISATPVSLAAMSAVSSRQARSTPMQRVAVARKLYRAAYLARREQR